MKLLDTLANAFPVWVLVASGLSLVRPELFTWFRGTSIVVGQLLIMPLAGWWRLRPQVDLGPDPDVL